MSIFHIATTGNDTTGNGSESTPWATFAKFLSSSASGDTCVCAAGSYTWTTATVTSRTIRAASPTAPAIFDGAGATFVFTLSGDVVFENLIFEDALTTAVLFALNTCTSLLCTNCVFRSIKTLGGASASNRGVFSTTTFTVLSRTLTYVNCLFDDLLDSNTGTANLDFVWGKHDFGTSNVNTVTLTNCIIYLATSGSGDSKNNLFMVSSGGQTLAVVMTNTIVANFNGETVTLGNQVAGTLTYSLTNCCFYNLTSVPSGTDLITSDPLFVDAANDAFDLRPTSPCLNTGTLV